MLLNLHLDFPSSKFLHLCFAVRVCTISVDHKCTGSHDRSFAKFWTFARALTDVPVSQSEYGPDPLFMQNVVVLSAGGNGNDSVPLSIGRAM